MVEEFEHSKLIDGKAIAAKRQEKLIEQIKLLEKPINITSILVGDDPASVMYTNLKQKKAAEVGITFTPLNFSETADFREVAEKIKQLNQDPEVDGIMIQLPLPKAFLQEHQTSELTELIEAKKDIDGLSSNRLVPPAAVAAVLNILEHEYITVFDMPVAVMGASDLVGKPLAEELSKMGAHVSVIDIDTPNPAEITQKASLIITAVGKPGVLTGEMINEGAVVIDVGTLVIQDQNDERKVLGDVDFESVLPKAKRITPVPGGVGPVTIVALLENCVQLKTRNHKSEIRNNI